MNESFPERGVVFWPVGTGDSTTIVVDDGIVVQVDIHDMDKADGDDTPETPVVDRLAGALPPVDGKPYLAVFVLTHADQDHCRGFADLLAKVHIGELWATPRLWREFQDPDAVICDDARAFQEEAERRVAAIKEATAKGKRVTSGDRILVIGRDTDDDEHSYGDLPDEYLAGPGEAISRLDGADCSDRFEAFLHAPFKDDCAAPRNETSVAMQVTLKHETGATGQFLLFGDLAHDTIMKIFDYSEKHDRPERLAWDVLLAPHHCSKKVMYVTGDNGAERLAQDVLDAFGRHGHDGAVVVSSSAPVPSSNSAGDNPPHAKAKARYTEIDAVAQFVCTMEWPDADRPEPVVFELDESGLTRLPASTPTQAVKSLRRSSRLALVAGAAAAVGILARHVADRARPAGSTPATATGPETIRQAITQTRGSTKAPTTVTGFGRA